MPRPSEFAAVWLRDNCACAECRDPGSQQKLFQITDLPTELALSSETPVDLDGAPGWEVVWSPDGHRSRYADTWLAPPGDAEREDRTEETKLLWRAADLNGALPEGSWADYRQGGAVKARLLDAVAQLGFCLLRDVPVRDGQVLAVAESFGFVRETNYGRLFEVRVQERPNNLAFTGARITPHTDNPYRDPVPTLQLLHCLVNSASGGDSGLVDGFAAAALLREEDPSAFEVLSSTPVPFAFADRDTALRAHRPLIGLDPQGRIREIRFNNRSLGTLRLPGERTAAFYAAYRTFAELLLRPELCLDFRLGPGDCLVFDNTRLLHARTAFESSGGGHLQGCYADLDGLLSTRAVLRRNEEDRSEQDRAVLDLLESLFDGQGAAEYLGEEVTQAQHMLQAGALAQAAGAPPALVAAALLHDVGHLRGEVTGHDLMAGTDNRHSHTGAQWLARWFAPEVTEPVRLHVDAKRYLCAVEPGYVNALSPASVHTLAVQGGPMSPAQADAFAAEPFGADAVRLRRWDEEAKNPSAPTPAFGHFRPLLAGLLRARRRSAAPGPGPRVSCVR
ncbi:phosphonate degradation HD-domain oxygenase [Streptacidiphilus sp. N1-12]|uniref:Phosphonate degradation HD-domain oxygenase n=2 Tax=Streptacidiphilus alkalitolerans TaxID=3342712 RepID=A0ABV6VEH3_9ACTN